MDSSTYLFQKSLKFENLKLDFSFLIIILKYLNTKAEYLQKLPLFSNVLVAKENMPTFLQSNFSSFSRFQCGSPREQYLLRAIAKKDLLVLEFSIRHSNSKSVYREFSLYANFVTAVFQNYYYNLANVILVAIYFVIAFIS